MIETVYDNYLFKTKLGLNTDVMRDSSLKMEKLLQKHFYDKEQSYKSDSAESAKYFASYNILLYCFPEFHNLYEGIRKTFHEIADKITPENNHYIQCWLNVYREGDQIGWHGHWPSEKTSWHGFYCVDCEPSKTTYRIPNGSSYNEIDVESVNDNLIIGKSDNDLHRTWPWEKDSPRITIAFDIVPARFIDNEQWLNHWIPI